MYDGVCPKCQSTDVIPQVRVMDQTDYNEVGALELGVVVDENPGAFIFKGKRRGTLYAWICGVCGFTELYVSNPGGLLEAYKKSQET